MRRHRGRIRIAVAAVGLVGIAWGGCQLIGPGRVRTPPVLPWQAGGKWGFVDPKGRIVVKPVYDRLTSLDPTADGYYIVIRDGKVGVVDEAGRLVVPCRYDLIDRTTARLASEGLFCVAVDDSPPASPPTPRGFCQTRKHSFRYGYVDLAGREVIEPRYRRAWPFCGNVAPVYPEPPVESSTAKGNRSAPVRFIDRTGRYCLERPARSASPLIHDERILGYWVRWPGADDSEESSSRSGQFLGPDGKLHGRVEDGLSLHKTALQFGFLVVRSSRTGKLGTIQLDGEGGLACEFDSILPIGPRTCLATRKRNGTEETRIVGPGGKMVSNHVLTGVFWHHETWPLVMGRSGAGRGAVNARTGRTVMKFIYDDLYYRYRFHRFLATAGVNRVGLFSPEGEALTPLRYSAIARHRQTGGFVARDRDGHVHWLDRDGKVLSRSTHTVGHILQPGGAKYVGVGNHDADGWHMGLMDSSGRLVVPMTFDFIKLGGYGGRLALCGGKDKLTVLDLTTGETLFTLSGKYRKNDVDSSHGGCVWTTSYEAKGPNYTIYDRQGKLLLTSIHDIWHNWQAGRTMPILYASEAYRGTRPQSAWLISAEGNILWPSPVWPQWSSRNVDVFKTQQESPRVGWVWRSSAGYHVVAPTYDAVQVGRVTGAPPGASGTVRLLKVSRKGRWALVTPDGQQVTEFRYTEIRLLKSGYFLTRAVGDVHETTGLLTPEGKPLCIEPVDQPNAN